MANKSYLILPLALVMAVGIACGPSITGGNGDGGGDDDVIDGSTTGGDGGAIDAPQVLPTDGAAPADVINPFGDADLPSQDGGCPGTTCPMPVGDGYVATEICDNGSDDNGNLMVDEGCPCTAGAVQACFRGPPARRNVGSCQDGSQVCTTEFGWSECTGGITPSTDVCDTQDNNCNGCVDDNPECCVVALMCPGPGDMPDGSPFVNYVIDGTMFFGGPVSTWNWTVTGGPCDQLLESTSGTTSYTLTGVNTSTLTIHPTLSGDYTVTVTMTLPDGTVYTCTFIVHIEGPGLRVELCWDTTGSTDIDLHVHKPGTTTDWFSTTGSSSNVNPDDCYYINCKAADFAPCPFPPFPPGLCTGWGADNAEWGYPSSPLSECSGGPEGATWSTVGSCHNPRLDVDNISTAGIPENINVDNPPNLATFRAMVHFFGGSGTTHPMVNVYCGGTLLGTYGAAPDTVSGFNMGGGFSGGQMWRVVDIQTLVAGGITTGCNLTPIVDGAGNPIVTTGNRTY